MNSVKNLKVKTCPICGTAFTPTAPQTKYCSPSCRAQAQRKQNRDHMRRVRDLDPVYKACKHCGRTFRVNRYNRTYCSKTCMREHAKARRKAYEATHRAQLNDTRLKWAHANPDKVKAAQEKYYAAADLKTDYVPPECRARGQTSCLTCTLPPEECHG